MMLFTQNENLGVLWETQEDNKMLVIMDIEKVVCKEGDRSEFCVN